MALKKEQPLLTIAIPTYNRANYLDETLKSIVSQSVFKETNEVEIVVSDNCSDDNTQEVVEKYIKEFGDKILYFRNKENVRDKNMELALSRGNGLFLKLNNDTLKHHQNALDIINNTIKSNIASKNVLFFLNSNLNKNPSSLCLDLNEFVNRASYYSTWIASFGIWKEDFDALEGFDRYAALQLTQTDVLHRIINNTRKVLVNNDSIFTTQELKSKGGYDIITVFLENYTCILRESLSKNYITKSTYQREVKTLLMTFICSTLVNMTVFPKKHTFTSVNKFKRIIYFYRAYPFILAKFFLRYSFLILNKKKLIKMLNYNSLV